jgi:hypothetical protein
MPCRFRLFVEQGALRMRNAVLGKFQLAADSLGFEVDVVVNDQTVRPCILSAYFKKRFVKLRLARIALQEASRNQVHIFKNSRIHFDARFMKGLIN